MIPHTAIPVQAAPLQTTRWQEELSQAVRDPRELFELLELDPSTLPAALAAHQDFKLMAPRPYLAKIRKRDINDPLLAQILPLGAELAAAPGYNADPLGENSANPAPGLIHKYHGRVLLIVSPVCAIHCRYCFRRHFPYEDNQPGRKEWQQALSYISNDSSISEVIFSGGDPLAANDHQLAWLSAQIAAFPHIKRLRVHTRFPVVIPSRINNSCLQWLRDSRLKTSVVLHVNHPNELGEDTRGAVERLKASGIDVLNQAVLLKGVNDNAETLITLSEKLYDTGILPYYLHVLDTVQGAAHFTVARHKIIDLQQHLLTKLPGYLVPKIVIEQSGASSKLPI
jgi:L-lysine 2,3-aminomutase